MTTKQTNKGRITRVDQAWGPAHFEYAHREALHEHALRSSGWRPDAPLSTGLAVRDADASQGAQGPDVIPATQSLTLPLKLLLAALSASGKDDIRHYLNGVYLHRAADGDLRIVGTDGHRLLASRYVMPKGERLPEWADAGVILPRAELAEILPIIGRHTGGNKFEHVEPAVVIEHRPGAPRFVVRSVADFAAFNLQPIDGKFPDYERVLQSAGQCLASAEGMPLEGTAINREYLKGAADVAGKLGATGVHSFMGDGTCAAIFTFDKAPDTMLIVMPMRSVGTAVSDGVVKLLGPSGMAGSVAALKAHVTRTTKALTICKDDGERKQLESRKLGFEERIAGLLASANAVPQLEHREAA